MRLFPRLSSRYWIFVLLCALGFLIWNNWERARRVDYVTKVDAEDALIDASSATGYAGGKRWLIVPEHNPRSYQWIIETQQMLAKGEWRVRHIDLENAPFGRDVYSTSPYRWWLGFIAWLDHSISARPLGLSVERAALWADPILHLLLLFSTALFVARRFGVWPATLISVGLVTIYPFAGSFLPGAPDDHALARVFALWSVLPLLAAVRGKDSLAAKLPDAQSTSETAKTDRETARLFFLAGVSGGFGMWVSPSVQVPVLLGILFGGLLLAVMMRRQSRPGNARIAETPWRTWALGGAATCLTAYLVEFFPAHMHFRLEVIHPMHALAWIGAGELLTFAREWSERGRASWNLRRGVGVILAVAAIAALPVAMERSETRSLFAGDLATSRLTNLPNGIVAKNFSSWLGTHGITASMVATCLPLLLLLPAVWLLFRRNTNERQRSALALVLGPVLVALPLATYQLAWWNTLGCLLLVLGVAAVASGTNDRRSGVSRWITETLAALIFLIGLKQLLPLPSDGQNIAFTRLEVEGLIERGLAHWISDHAGAEGAVILAPPYRTSSLSFYGRLRGLGTANWENRDGLTATVRIVTATTVDEAHELIQQRGVTHIILPSWDADLDAFARWSLSNPDDAFLMALHHWALPPWLRPLPYQLPAVPGFENQTVAILQVTEEGNRAAALSRMAEYFVEMNRTEHAAASVASLERYPADLGALVALAKIAKFRGDSAGFSKAFKPLLSSVAAGFERTLAWDRRVSLAVVLALGERNDLAREQVRRCLEQVDESRIRTLTTGSLHHLLELSRAYELNFPDPKVREQAIRLLPTELRRRL